MNCYPTEAQVVALLDAVNWPSLRELSEWNGCTPFDNVLCAIVLGRFTWRGLFDEPEFTLAQTFDDWRDEFRDLFDDEPGEGLGDYFDED